MWHVLELAPTADAKAIKRAYARLLKQTRPEDDPEGFQRLRQAYEWALQQSAWLSAANALAVADVADVPEVRDEASESSWAARDDGPTPPVPEQEAGFAPVLPASPVEPDWPAQAATAVTRVTDQLTDADTPMSTPPGSEPWRGVLSAMWRAPQWRIPAAADALADAWDAWLNTQVLADDDGIPNPHLHHERLLLAEAVAEQLGWLNQPVAEPHGAHGSRHAHLGSRLAQRWAYVLCALPLQATQDSPQGNEGGAAEAAATLRALLARPTWQTTAARHALERALAYTLWFQYWQPEADAAWVQGPQRPTMLRWLHEVVQCFDWQGDALLWARVPEIQRLLDIWLRQRDHQLLQRVATGAEVNEHIPKDAAQALLQPRIRPEDRRAVRQASDDRQDKKSWQVQVREAIAWMDQHAPAALQGLDPVVLVWWRREHVQANDVWNIAAMLCGFSGAFWFMGVAEAYGHWSGWILAPFWLMGLIGGALLGLQIAAALAWLRLQWRLRPYVAWLRFDQQLNVRLASHWQPWQRIASAADLGPTRDLIPGLSLWVWQFHSLWTKEGGSPWQALAVALVPTLIGLWVWRGSLRLLARP